MAATAALFALAGPPLAGAQSADQSVTGASSDLTGLIPEQIVVGGDLLGTGSEGLRAVGSAPLADAGLSAAQTVGSSGSTEALGLAGGAAALSVASSGLVPGSTYVNATGSVGSGVIGLGSIAIPEYVIGIAAVQAAGLYTTVMGARQEAGALSPAEVDFWHNAVVGSAQAGATLEAAAAGAGVALPGGLAGSIDAVQLAAVTNPNTALPAA